MLHEQLSNEKKQLETALKEKQKLAEECANLKTVHEVKEEDLIVMLGLFRNNLVFDMFFQQLSCKYDRFVSTTVRSC